ncbi:MAG: TrkH family potassium uptake protein [Candidatus Nezhaarchaeota archaeon]|nr:TrkH family potassium uptake protein [Candidatus Nezhaarchaeota archaeon]
MRTVVALISRILVVVGATMVISVAVSLAYGETVPATSLSFSALATIGAALPGLRLPLPGDVRLTEAMATASIGWLTVAFFGSLPYALAGYMDFLDAYFESMSGFTTTGMTLIRAVEPWPRGLLFWRAFTQWLGGVGVVLFLLLFIAPSGVEVWRLYVAEAREERLTVRSRDVIKEIWAIYVCYTATCALVLLSSGLEPFEAICHSFTVLSTGGFSTRTSSIASFSSPVVEAVLVVFMIVGATNFRIHSLVLKLRLREALKDPELKAMLLILAAASSIILVDLALHGFLLGESLRLALFQASSIMTTTGYTTVDINYLPSLSQATLLLLMVVGGSVCSTAGGVKVIRLVVLSKVIQREVARTTLPPSAIKPIKVGGRVLELEDALKIASFLLAYLLMVGLATLLIAAEGHGITAALSAVLSAQGNVGPAYISLFNLGPLGKLTLIACMWAGRLELMPVFLLFSPKTWVELMAGR